MAEKLKALKEGDHIDFCWNKMPKCPHCGNDFDIEANEAWELYDEDTHEIECLDCGLPFQVIATAEWKFSTDEQEDDEDE